LPTAAIVAWCNTYESCCQNMMYEQVRRNGARVVDEVRALDVLVLGVPQAQKQRIVAALSRNPKV
jgi:hypothetical protein